MKHVRVTLSADGLEADVHPMYDVLANAPYVERATAMHWNFTGDRLGIMHYVEGDADAFAAALSEVPQVVEYELTRVGEREFYAYVSDETTPALREMFDAVSVGSLVVLPPVQYREDGTVAFSVVGPGADVQAAIERVPEPVSVAVESVGGLAGAPGVAERTVSDRQREAVETALSLGYYEVPREADHEDVAAAMDCAPSTAAEHLRKAESAVLRAVFGGDG